MVEGLRKYKNTLLFAVLVISTIIALGLFPHFVGNSVGFNVIIEITLTYLTLSQLLGKKHLLLWPVLWSCLMVFGPLGIWGIIPTGTFWYLFFHRQSTEESTTGNRNRRRSRLPRRRVDADETVLLELQPIIPIPFCRIPAFWRKVRLTKRGKSYTFKNVYFGWIEIPTNLCQCSNADLNLIGLQILRLDHVVVLTSEEIHPRKIFLPAGEGARAKDMLNEYITDACKANDIKRNIISGRGRRHHQNKK